MNNELARVSENIQARFPSASVTVENFPSGSGQLSVTFKENLFVMEYRPKEGFGVSKVREGEEWLPGHDYVNGNVNQAEQRLISLLEQECRS
jgi:hypothetical protein